jgi:hypothetical protein
VLQHQQRQTAERDADPENETYQVSVKELFASMNAPTMRTTVKITPMIRRARSRG